jgi:uncharacterized protein (DUF3820 family)
VISGLLCLALKIGLGSDELLIGVTSVLVVITFIADGGNHDPLGPPLWPPLVASGVPLCTLVCCLGLRPLTAARGRLLADLHENSPDCFLARGVPSGDVEELLHGLWLVTAELVHQGSTVCVRPERRDDIGVTDLGEFMTLLRETLDITPQGFPLLLPATLQILEIVRLHICALKVAGEELLKIFPTINRVSRQVIEPSSRCVNQVNGAELDDEEVIVYPARLTREVVVL